MNLNEKINKTLTKILDYTKIMSRSDSPLLDVYHEAIQIVQGGEKVDHHSQDDSSSSLVADLAKELNNKQDVKQEEKIITVLEDVIRSNKNLQEEIDLLINKNKNGGQVAAAKVRNSKKDVDKEYRILDSMARMLTGENICTAVMIHNDQLVVANNQGDYGNASKVLEIIKEHYRTKGTVTARNAEEASGLAQALSADLDKAEALSRELNGQLIIKGGNDKRADNKKQAIERDAWKFSRFLYNIRIVGSENDETKNDKLKQALQKNVRYLNKRVNKTLPHAEMQILDFLYQELKESNPQKIITARDFKDSLSNTGQNLYIGVSKLCCLGCSTTIEVLMDKNVATRGDHNKPYDSWVTPNFVEELQIENAILEKLQENQYKIAIHLAQQRSNRKHHSIVNLLHLDEIPNVQQVRPDQATASDSEVQHYIIEDTGRDINTQQRLANLAKTPSRSTLKGSRESAKQEAQQIGADLARKQASPKEQAKEDQKVALNITRKTRANKRSQGR